MSRWSDLATWRGPTPNQSGAMREHRGVVVHIAAGYYEGTIAWQKNDSSNVSSHFIVDRDGDIAQMVDTDITAWTQSDGNGHWLSVENAGFLLGSKLWQPGWHELTPAMIEANAQLLARAHREYGVPLQLAGSPTGRGLGYHSMGAENGYDWGHSACPGEPIKAQLPLILARAIEIVGGDMTPQEQYIQHVINYRAEALKANRPIIKIPAHPGGPAITETNELAVAINDLKAQLAKLATGGVDPAALAQLLADRLPTADGIADKLAARLAQ